MKRQGIRLLAGLTVLGALRAAEPASNNGPVVSLPPMLVEEKGATISWRYLELAGREILSACDDDTTVEFMRRQYRLDETLTVMLPEKFRARFALPEAHVLFNEEIGRARSREVITAMIKKAGANVAPDGTMTAPGGNTAFGGFGSRPTRVQVLPNLRLSDADSVSVFTVLDEATSGRLDFRFSNERIDFLVARRVPGLPDWCVAGLQGLYRQAAFRRDEIEFAPANWISDEETKALARDPDRPRTLLPMAELFAAGRRGTGPDASELDRVWRAQSVLFVRWALLDEKGAHRPALWRWLERLDDAPPSEALFRECFGLGYADTRDRLSDYLASALAERVTIDAPPPGPTPKLRPRPATPAEIARIRGDWERLEIPWVRKNFPALAPNYVEQARKTLRRAYDLGERDPRLVASLGLVELEAGNPLAARGFLEDAVKAKVVRPRAYLELARLRYIELAGPKTDRPLNAEEAATVLEPLRVGRRQDPPLPEIYALMASVWLHSTATPSAEDLATLAEGVRSFPSATGLVLAAVQIHVANGAIGPALAFTATGQQHAADPAARASFERVRAQLVAVRP